MFHSSLSQPLLLVLSLLQEACKPVFEFVDAMVCQICALVEACFLLDFFCDMELFCEAQIAVSVPFSVWLRMLNYLPGDVWVGHGLCIPNVF